MLPAPSSRREHSNRMRLTLLFLMTLLVSGPLARAAEMFPLKPGAVWEYRAEGVADPLIIRVGYNQLYAGGKVYSRLTGYVAQPVWARLDEAGDLYYLDEETGQDLLLTMLDVDNSVWFEAPLRECELEGQAHADKVPYPGPTGAIADTLAVRYRTFSCADAGIEAELFAANVGMVLRSVSSIAGPVVYWLTYADTGSVQLARRNGTTLRLSLEQKDPQKVTARLRLTADLENPSTVVFPSDQEFDFLLRDERGQKVWQWSDGRVFSQVFHERSGDNLSYEVEIPLPVLQQPLPNAFYTVEAWLTTSERERSPRTSAVLRPTEQPDRASSKIQPLRARK